MKHFLSLALVAASLCAYSQTQDHPDGKISGTVIDQNGNPVPAASVYAIPQDLILDGVTPRSTKTDKNGAFDFRGSFQLGAYKLYARKEAEDYPDSSDTFYADSKSEAPQADLSEDHPSAALTVTLGEKAGVLSGRVIDASTGASLKAKLVFTDKDGNSHAVFANGEYRTLLPPGKDVTLLVMLMAPDYHPQSPPASLRLEPGQQMHMDIRASK
jgi:hypothetical protein